VAFTRALAAQGGAAGGARQLRGPRSGGDAVRHRALADDAVGGYVRDRQPLTDGPIAAEDVPASIAFLCSPAARAFTGRVLAVDAGWRLDPS
jgi:3-hydroxybutyrate dehydrogenase